MCSYILLQKKNTCCIVTAYTDVRHHRKLELNRRAEQTKDDKKICQSSSTYDNNIDIENAEKEYTFMIFNNYINKYK